MRGALRAFMLAFLVASFGCHHDKYNMNPTVKEQYAEPPNEARYNLPDTAGYRKPAAPKEDKTMTGKMGGGPGGGGF